MDQSTDNWSEWGPTPHLRWVRGVLNQQFERRREITPRVAGSDAYDRAVEWEGEEEWREVEGAWKGDWDFLPGMLVAILYIAGGFWLLAQLIEIFKTG